jgi:hypothetical protein
MKNNKPTIFCGVYHEMKEVEKNNFIKMMSEDGKYNVVFDGGNTIPKLVEMSLPFIDLKSDSDNNF